VAGRSGEALVVTMRELSRNTGKIVKQVRDEQRVAIVTGPSGFAAILQPLDPERIHRLVVESAQELVATRESSEQALARGKTITASALADELGVDLMPKTATLRAVRRAPRRAQRVATQASTKAAKAASRSSGKARVKRAGQ
jgi:hypothetical protein